MIDREQFYTEKSRLIGKIMDFIELCNRFDKNYYEEIKEIVNEVLPNQKEKKNESC